MSAATRRQPPWLGWRLPAERLSPIALRLRAQERCGGGGLALEQLHESFGYPYARLRVVFCSAAKLAAKS